jgi:prefoldin subunit 5
MELNSKKLERTSRLVNYSISTILCVFLILLSNRIIDDLDSTTRRPYSEDFEDRTAISALDEELDQQYAELQNLKSKMETVEKTIATAKENYVNEKQSFDNWLQTRKTLGSPDKDKEVIDRANRLDDFYKVEQEWRAQLNAIQSQIDEKENEMDKIQNSIYGERSAAYEKYGHELKWYEFKVFLIRMVFVAPVLTLGIFFFLRYRRHKFYPLYFGFTLFSVYAFFFGLVPYLPSYGGYVRYSVGVILSVGLGFYAIKHIRKFVEQKQAELKISTQERAKTIQTTTAEKALENHFCPSCGKDFLLRKWEFPVAKPTDTDMYKFVTTFCRHCGLELFKNCSNCGTKNFAHLLFCSSCGTKVNS